MECGGECALANDSEVSARRLVYLRSRDQQTLVDTYCTHTYSVSIGTGIIFILSMQVL